MADRWTMPDLVVTVLQRLPDLESLRSAVPYGDVLYASLSSSLTSTTSRKQVPKRGSNKHLDNDTGAVVDEGQDPPFSPQWGPKRISHVGASAVRRAGPAVYLLDMTAGMCWRLRFEIRENRYLHGALDKMTTSRQFILRRLLALWQPHRVIAVGSFLRRALFGLSRLAWGCILYLTTPRRDPWDGIGPDMDVWDGINHDFVPMLRDFPPLTERLMDLDRLQHSEKIVYSVMDRRMFDRLGPALYF